MRILYGKSTQCTSEILNYDILAFYFANLKVKSFPRHFYLFYERLPAINKAFLIKARSSEGSQAISLLRRRTLKMYRKNQKEEQICFDLLSVEQKADLPLSNGVSKQLYLTPFDFFLFFKRESSRRGIGKLRKRFGN